MTTGGPLRAERDGELLRITLARPDRRNALDAELIAALTAAFSDVGDARAVVLAGEGDSFCAGADVEWMRAAAALSYEENVADSTRLRRMYEALDRCPGRRSVLGERHGLGRRLRPAVDDHGQRPLEKQLGGPASLDRREQDPLPGRPERQDSV